MSRKTLPKFFSDVELDDLLDSRYPAGFRGRRDRALLEVLVATGLRASELLALCWGDVGPDKVFVRHGKGGRQRYVPLTDRAWAALRAVRPTGPGRADPVFLNAWGDPLSRRGLHKIVKGYLRAAGLRGSCHTLRHSLATRLLNRGMNLRSVQAILGHAWVTTTQVHTHLATDALVDQYRRAMGGAA